jgi:hypothetical protein
MRAIYTIVLLPVVTVLCFGQEEGAPKNELAFGLGGGREAIAERPSRLRDAFILCTASTGWLRANQCTDSGTKKKAIGSKVAVAAAPR